MHVEGFCVVNCFLTSFASFSTVGLLFYALVLVVFVVVMELFLLLAILFPSSCAVSLFIPLSLSIRVLSFSLFLPFFCHPSVFRLLASSVFLPLPSSCLLRFLASSVFFSYSHSNHLLLSCITIIRVDSIVECIILQHCIVHCITSYP